MENLEQILKKSSILTHHTQSTTRHHASLPSLHPSAQFLPSPKKPKTLISMKARPQMVHEERVKSLLKLKTRLDNSHHQQVETVVHKQPPAVGFVESIELRLNSMMPDSEGTSHNRNNPEDERDPDCEEFCGYCQIIVDLYALGTREKNMRYKNKVRQIISNATHFTLLNELCLHLEKGDQKLEKIYLSFRRPYLREPTFRKELKVLSLRCGYTIEGYQKSRYKLLNEDINRIKVQMRNDGMKVGLQLNHIDNYNLRRGVFSSLKQIQLRCLANRYYYSEHADRLRKVHE